MKEFKKVKKPMIITQKIPCLVLGAEYNKQYNVTVQGNKELKKPQIITWKISCLVLGEEYNKQRLKVVTICNICSYVTINYYPSDRMYYSVVGVMSTITS